MSAKWHQERPYISGGPLNGSYVFSQMHFHWGKDNMEGSEHTIDGSPHPLEMHVVLFKSCYLTQEAALKKRDGILVIVYFFKLQGADNTAMDLITGAIPYIQLPHTSARLDPLPLSYFMIPFDKDYFMYWGTVTTTDCVHVLLWLISREPIGISFQQLETFRTLLNIEEAPLQGNFRPTQDSDGIKRTVFHANPSLSLYSTLLPIRKRNETAKNVPEAKAKGENEGDQVEIEIFRVEPQCLPPPGDKKETNKYTISTSLKVAPGLLEKVKGPKNAFKEDEAGSEKNQVRRLESTRSKTQVEVQKGWAAVSSSGGGFEVAKKCAKKPSLIPRLIPRTK